MDSEDEISVANSEGSEYIDNDNESITSDTDAGDDADDMEDVSINEGYTEDIEQPDEGQSNIAIANTTNIDNISENGSVNISDDDDDEDDDEENYFEKLNGFSEKTLETYHPESCFHNYDEIETLARVVRDSNNRIIDPFHKTLPIMTKYEKARILGQRAKQIDNNAFIFVKTEDNIIDSYKIAEIELKAKKIPFIIKRPLPGGACEYWKVKDLEILGF